MVCRTLLVKMQSPGGGSWYPCEGNRDAHERILVVENTCTASKMISTWDIVPFSLPKYENTCIFIKHLRNVIPVWWVWWLRKDIRETFKSLGSGKHPSSRFWIGVWNLFACVCSYVCVMETGNRNQEILILSLQRSRSSWLHNKWEKWKMMLEQFNQVASKKISVGIISIKHSKISPRDTWCYQICIKGRSLKTAIFLKSQ